MPAYLIRIAENLASGEAQNLAEAEEIEGVVLTPEERKLVLEMARGE